MLLLTSHLVGKKPDSVVAAISGKWVLSWIPKEASLQPHSQETAWLMCPNLSLPEKCSLRKNWCYRAARWSEVWNCFCMKALQCKKKREENKGDKQNCMAWRRWKVSQLVVTHELQNRKILFPRRTWNCIFRWRPANVLGVLHAWKLRKLLLKEWNRHMIWFSVLLQTGSQLLFKVLRTQQQHIWEQVQTTPCCGDRATHQLTAPCLCTFLLYTTVSTEPTSTYGLVWPNTPINHDLSRFLTARLNRRSDDNEEDDTCHQCSRTHLPKWEQHILLSGRREHIFIGIPPTCV